MRIFSQSIIKLKEQHYEPVDLMPNMRKQGFIDIRILVTLYIPLDNVKISSLLGILINSLDSVNSI